MGYVEKVMGDHEREAYRTHQHVIVLFGKILASLFVFLVFLVAGLVILIPEPGESGNQIRSIMGLIVLGSLVMPLYMIASAWLRGLRGSEFAWGIWRAVLAGILIFAFSLIVLLHPEWRLLGLVALVLALVPLAEVIRIFADWLYEQYIITNRRVMRVRGIINKNITDSALEKVNDVQMNQSFFGRILGYGTVEIITGSDIGVNIFRRISNPVRFKREMLNAKEGLHRSDLLEQPDPVPATEAVAPGDAGPVDRRPYSDKRLLPQGDDSHSNTSLGLTGKS